jgi:hypothetical protein
MRRLRVLVVVGCLLALVAVAGVAAQADDPQVDRGVIELSLASNPGGAWIGVKNEDAPGTECGVEFGCAFDTNWDGSYAYVGDFTPKITVTAYSYRYDDDTPACPFKEWQFSMGGSPVVDARNPTTIEHHGSALSVLAVYDC